MVRKCLHICSSVRSSVYPRLSPSTHRYKGPGPVPAKSACRGDCFSLFSGLQVLNLFLPTIRYVCGLITLTPLFIQDSAKQAKRYPGLESSRNLLSRRDGQGAIKVKYHKCNVYVMSCCFFHFYILLLHLLFNHRI